MYQASQLLNKSIVVFSKSYLPISQVNIKHAIRLLVTDKAEPLDLGRDNAPWFTIRSPSMVLRVPAHIRLKINHTERSWKVPAVSRREVLRRDNHTCQYCGSTRRLTLDHIVPRSKGGRHSWDNVVTACEPCNTRKGNRTPQQAGMALQSQPGPPRHPVIAFAADFWREHA